MAKVRVKPRSQPAPQPRAADAAPAGCRRCQQWAPRYFKEKGVQWLHDTLCAEAVRRAEVSKANYFSLTIGEVRDREAERMLMDMLAQKDAGSTDPAPLPAPNQPAPSKSPKPARKAPDGPDAPEQPNGAAKAPPAQRTGDSGAGKDAFGFRLGSGAALINEALTAEPSTVAKIAARSKATRTPNGQILKMVELGYLEQLPGKKYRLTPKALAVLKASE